jgi:glycosyltransferase involved in cell wall biosynthesis
VVVPSKWYENAPMSVLEACAAGVPVIASRIGGIPEILEDGVTGLLVPPGDVRALAREMRRLYEDVRLAESLGAAARSMVRARFSPASHTERLLASYREAIAG